jgi:DNA invertase Pin-like site-specific DNA recombinase
VKEYVDHGVSGAKERRPALDAMMADAKRRKLDVVVCWRLDRLGRNLRHLITMLDELRALGIAFVSLAEGIDATTPAGEAPVAYPRGDRGVERGRIQERVMAGLARARANGKRLGRPKAAVPTDKLLRVKSMSNLEPARALGVSVATVKRWRAAQKSLTSAA